MTALWRDQAKVALAPQVSLKGQQQALRCDFSWARRDKSDEHVLLQAVKIFELELVL